LEYVFQPTARFEEAKLKIIGRILVIVEHFGLPLVKLPPFLHM
jgi:hypothetical protein